VIEMRRFMGFARHDQDDRQHRDPGGRLGDLLG
jgi:hypothetical protein